MTTSCGRSSCAWRSASSRSLPGVEAEGTSPDDEGSLEELIPIVRRSLDSGDHLALMGLASATLAIVRHPAEPAAPVGDGASDRVLEHLVLRYVEHASPEALAYASAMTALVEPGPLRTSLCGALDGVDDQLPGWLADIDRTRLDTPTVVRDLFDDDEWLLAGMRFVDDGRAAFRVSVDHGAEGAVVDAVLMRQTVDEVRQQLRATAPEDEVAITDVSASELAERYADAVAAGEDARTDTWPSSRPLIEWALRLG
jgi:hypothetical protein